MSEDGDDAAAKRRRVGEEAAKAETADEGASEDLSKRVVDAEYFESYADLSIHALMLSDKPRVGAYAAAFKALRASLEGKVVLDVGCGSGVLSMLAARLAGAAKVYAVEAAPGMARLARDLVARNGLAETVTVIEGRMEEVELPEKVDAIVSEWMGFYLVHESMLESVLAARDRWLKPGGLMLPQSARIWAAPVEAEELRRELDSYGDIMGLDLGPVGEAELERRMKEPQVESVEPGRMLATPVLVQDLDFRSLLHAATREMSAEVSFVTLRSGHAAGLALWFDVGFGDAPGHPQEVLLDTAPGAPPTHWKQTVVYLGVFAPIEAGDDLSATLLLRQSEANPRQYDITVET